MIRKATTKVEPLTFLDLPWVKGINRLSGHEWLLSNPDGLKMLKDFGVYLPTNMVLDAMAPPLRNLVRLMLYDGLPDYDDAPYSMREMIEDMAPEAPIWRDTARKKWRSPRDFEKDEGIDKSLKRLKKKFTAVPLTYKAFLRHLRADVKHYLAESVHDKCD